MKKITDNAVNRTAHSQRVDLEALRKSGVSRDNIIFRKDDIIEIPEEINCWVDTFIPKGETKPIEYYLITGMKNGVIYDITMASFRRSLLITDEDKLVVNSKVNDHLSNLGDDEQRAVYLQGKTFKVKDTIKCTNRWTDKPIYVPVFEEIPNTL